MKGVSEFKLMLVIGIVHGGPLFLKATRRLQHWRIWLICKTAHVFFKLAVAKHNMMGSLSSSQLGVAVLYRVTAMNVEA